VTSPHLSALDDFFAHSPDILFLAGVDGQVLRASEALKRMFGASSGAGVSLLDLVHPNGRETMKAEWERLTTEGSGEPAVFECRLRVAGGDHRMFLCRARRAPGGDVHGSLRLTGMDDVESDRSAGLLRTLANNLDIIIWEVDRAGVLTYQEGKALEAVGMKPRQLVGQNLFDVYRSSPTSGEVIRRALEGQQTHFYAEEHNAYWETWFLPVLDEHERVKGVAGVSLNVTETRRTERELQARLDLIERQKDAIQALSIPIIQVWDRVLTVPLVGMVDSSRAAELMEKLLGEVVRTRARYAILDLTGVEAMDTGTACHMLRLVTALRLLGAEGILTGIRSSIAQTMVGLGLDMGAVRTLGSLRDGLRLCMRGLNEKRG